MADSVFKKINCTELPNLKVKDYKNESPNGNDTESNINYLCENPETENKMNQETNEIQKNIKLSEYEKIVEEYDKKCEIHCRLQKLVPLKKPCGKKFLFVFLNIITVGIINLIISWFPKIVLYIKYSRCEIKDATDVGIYTDDGNFFIEKLLTKNLPDINTSPLKSICVYKLSNPTKIVYFTFKLFNYIYYETSDSFKCFQFYINNSQKNIIEQLTGGLNQKEVEHQKSIFGICDLIIIVPSIFKLIAIEFSDPFYLFQVFAFLLWLFTNYILYSIMTIVGIVVSLTLSVYETVINLKSLKNMAKYACKVKVFRKNEKEEQVETNMMSTELVPGDLFELPDDGYALPCDCILVNGIVIVNESILTGESTPITKNSMPSVDVKIDLNTESKYTLFAGTKIVQKRAPGKEKVLAVVYKTGYESVKGNLIRSIIYPKELDKAFKAESWKYIIVMGSICIIGFAIILPFLIKKQTLKTGEIILKFLDLVTITVPPAITMCMTLGVNYALSRLKTKRIICIDRNRVNSMGKINLIAFDKTGTLTEDHLNIFGYRTVLMNNNKFTFNQLQPNADIYGKESYKHYKDKLNGKKNINEDLKKNFIECLACCHCNSMVRGRIIGDPIDVEIFKSCGWKLLENIDNQTEENMYVLSYVRPKGEADIHSKTSKPLNEEELKNHYELGIERRFDFSSKLQRMTVLAKNKNQSYYKAFCKGSPEKLKEICKESTIPENYDEMVTSYTSKGLRVLATAVKYINLTTDQCYEIRQSSVEKDMIFLGLIIVQNKLKSATKSSIKILDNAHLKMVMATGDNILTAIAVSRECNLLKGTIPVFSCDVNKSDENSYKLVWNPVNLSENKKKETINESPDKLILDISNNNLNEKNFIDVYPPVGYQKTEEIVENNNENDQAKEEVNNDDLEKSINLNLESEQLPFNNEDEFAIAITGKAFERKKIY